MLELRLTRAEAEAHRAAGHWGDRVLFDIVRAHAAERPDATALIDGETKLTYGELVALSGRVALGLLDLGVRRGDVVSVQLPNWHEFAVLLLAIERIGAVMNPLTPILRERELSWMLSAGRSKLLVVPEVFRGFRHAEMALHLQERLPPLRTLVVRGSTPGAEEWRRLTEDPWEERIDRRVLEYLRPEADDVTELAFSSGTTGEPKGILHTHNSALCAVGSTVRRQRLGRDDVVLVATPVGHNAGYFYGVRVALQAGAALVFQETWDGTLMAELIERHRVTFTMGTPTLLVDFLAAIEGGRKHDLSILSVFTCGGAFLSPGIAAEMEARLPGRLCPVFGMTEMGHATATDASTPREKAVTSDGSPQPEMSLRVADDAGRPVAPGQEGALMFRGPFLFAGYLQGRAFTEGHFDGEGYFDSGDIGYLDGEGYLRVTGRKKDLIIRGGENIPVREIEDLLMGHPAVAAVALVGVSDERLGERAVACVRPRPGRALSLDEVRSYLAGHSVTKQFWPEAVELFEELPMTPAGKVQKFHLRQALQRRAAGQGE